MKLFCLWLQCGDRPARVATLQDAQNEIYTSVEEGMFSQDSPEGKAQIFLRPKESVNVPFKFMSLRAGHHMAPPVSEEFFIWKSLNESWKFLYWISHTFEFVKFLFF